MFLYNNCFHTPLSLTSTLQISSYWSTILLSPLHPLLLSYPPTLHLSFTLIIFKYFNPFHFFSLHACSHHSERPSEGPVLFLYTLTSTSPLTGPSRSLPWSTQTLYRLVFSTNWLFICPDDEGSRIHYICKFHQPIWWNILNKVSIIVLTWQIHNLPSLYT
jgi:hypothetical protein